MKDRVIITIDGPAGAGKTTIAKKVAGRLGFRYIDTGAMYRAATLKVLESKIPFNNTEEIAKAVNKSEISLDFSGDEMQVFLDGKDVSEKIRSEEVTENTSLIAAMGPIRGKLVAIQRSSAEKFKKAVFEGRDTGTIVFPDADLKIYLDAGILQRAQRRCREIESRGETVDLDKLQRQIKERDRKDSSRGIAPLRVPEDAVIIDSTSMTIEQVTDKIVELLDQ